MLRHRVVALTAAVPLVLAAGCTSSGGKAASTSTSTSGSTGSSGSSSSAALAATLRKGVDGLTSTAIRIDAGGLLATTTGHLKLDAGKATASQITIGSGSDAIEVITVGSMSWARLPKGENTSGRPYVPVSPTSPNEFARGLVPTLGILNAASSLGSIADVVASANDVRNNGPKTVASVPTTHYALSVKGDANGSALTKLLAQLGSANVPIDLYLDSSGRPVQIVFSLTLSGAKVTVTVGLSAFNAPLTITAPSPNQVVGG